MIDIPTALTVGETNMLRKLSHDKYCVEAGSLLGYSTVVMSQQAKKMVAIDPHNGYPHYQPRPTLDVFKHNLTRCGVSDKVSVVVGLGADHLADYTPDMVFLDLTGFYQDTMECLEASKSRIICCHDYARNGCAGATDAVDVFCRRSGYLVTTVDTLAIIDTKRRLN